MLFFWHHDDGTTSGPHMPGVLLRNIEAGEMSWDDLICAQGTTDWVPAHVFEDVLDARGRELRAAETKVRHYRALLADEPARRRTKRNNGAWEGAMTLFIIGFLMVLFGVVLSMPLLPVLAGLPALGCFVCGVVCCAQGQAGRGVTAILLSLLITPVFLVRI